MGILKWMASLFTVEARGQNRGWQKDHQRKERNRVPRRRQPSVASTQSTPLPEPARVRERVPTPTNYTEPHRTATEIATIDKAARPTECVYCGETRAYAVGKSCKGCGATLPNPTELEKVIAKRGEVRQLLNNQYAAMQQQQMSMAQADALSHSVNQELAMITGMGRDPLQGIADTPYWQQHFGEIGKKLGPFHPQGGGLPRSSVLHKKAGK